MKKILLLAVFATLLQACVTKYVEIGTIGLIKSDELQSKKINRECLKGRGHSILN